MEIEEASQVDAGGFPYRWKKLFIQIEEASYADEGSFPCRWRKLPIQTEDRRVQDSYLHPSYIWDGFQS